MKLKSMPALWIEETLGTLPGNLAFDEALLLEAERLEGPIVCRIWEWGRLAVVLGASSRLGEEVEEGACERDGAEIARRASGGGVVLLGAGALNVTVILPISAAPELGTVEGAQRFALERLAASFRSAGVDAGLQGSGDLTIGDRKFAGSAQRRLRRHVLVHSSILYEFPLEVMGRYLKQPRRQPGYRRERAHDEFVTNVPVDRGVLVEVIREAWGGGSKVEVKTGWSPREQVEGLVEARFGDVGWIRRF